MWSVPNIEPTPLTSYKEVFARNYGDDPRGLHRDIINCELHAVLSHSEHGFVPLAVIVGDVKVIKYNLAWGFSRGDHDFYFAIFQVELKVILKLDNN